MLAVHHVLLILVLSLAPAAAFTREDPPDRTRVLRDGRFVLDRDGRAVDGQTVETGPNPERSIVAILPDRTTGEDWGLPHLERAVTDLNLLRPDAVFCVGDLVQGYTRDPETWENEVDDYLTIMNRLDAEFWPTAGNHDVISGGRDAGDRTFADRYRARFGPLHYAVQLEHGTMVVLFSDENLDSRSVDISDQQIEWLGGVLADADSEQPIVLLMHRPLWRYGKVRWEDRVHPILVEHGVDAVLAGHFHALHRDDDRDGVEYHLLGVCGGAIDQHPLTGQFNHLTLLDLGPGDEVHVRHLPSGVMLPDDFILRADQDRSYRLKSGRVATLGGRLEDPWNGPVRGVVPLEIRNPIDVPITVRVDPARAPRAWLVEGHAFVARTESDIANPSTTDLGTPFELNEVEAIEVAPGATATINLEFSASRTSAPPPPPEVRVRIEFEDTQGRLVPIILPRRVPIDRADASPADGVPSWPIAAWTHSVYEEREPLGSVSTHLVSDPTAPRLAIDLTIFDDRIADDGVPLESTVKTRQNPHGDLVVLELTTEAGLRRFLFEPALIGAADAEAAGDSGNQLVSLARNGGARIVPGAVKAISTPSGEPHRHRYRIEIPDIDPRSISGLQIRVADNDRTYHTQWRTLAPERSHLELDWPAP